MIERLLATLFPPKLPKLSPIEILGFDTSAIHEEGWAGNVRAKQYADAIDRHWKTQQA